MNLSMKWLNDYVKPQCDIKEYCHKMTMSGSKVEGYTGSIIENVVIGKLISVVPHPNSDHMFITQADVGKGQVQVVTGAQNIKEGDIVPVALVGAALPNGLVIKKSKLRGEESNGMLCSLSELNLTKNDFPYATEDGIFIIEEDVEIGQNVSVALGLDDISVEFEITSNRPDCLSVIGLSRETAATFNTPYTVKTPEFNGVDGDINTQLTVKIKETEKCRRYCAGLVKNVKIEPSPKWMRERLRASGVRPINNLVDITNYVMLEYGQPMHAFDLRFVDGGAITIRNAKDNEEIMTLDGVTRKLSADMLVIADTNKPIAVAGVMGGEFSGIMSDTNTVVFESAYFEPVTVRKTAKKLGIRSDASARYEKGVDPQISMTCLKRAFELVELLGAGEVLNTVIDCDYSQNTTPEIDWDPNHINAFLGAEIPKTNMNFYLKALDFKIEDGKVIPPSFRIDIETKADIAEEIARIYGYENIPSSKLRGIAEAVPTRQQKFLRSVAKTCAETGCFEVATFSFVSPKSLDKIGSPKDGKLRNTVTILNPLGEDTSIMRTTSLPSILEIVSTNINHRNPEGKFFEIGKEYIPTESDKLPQELNRLTIATYGNTDFYELKGILETIFERAGTMGLSYNIPKNEFEEQSAFHPYRTAVIKKGGLVIGIFGEIHPDTAKNYGFGTAVYAAKIDIDTLLKISKSEINYKPVPKFPAITRDLALVCDKKTTTAQIENIIKKSVGDILEDVKLFDVYEGEQVGDGKKSLAYSIVMRSSDGTLTDKQGDSAIENTLKNLESIAKIR